MGGVSRWVGGECGGAGKGRADVWKGWVGGKGMGGLPKKELNYGCTHFPDLIWCSRTAARVQTHQYLHQRMQEAFGRKPCDSQCNARWRTYAIGLMNYSHTAMFVRVPLSTQTPYTCADIKIYI